MAREDQNEAFLKTSFLYGGNADYIEALQARYEKDPSSGDAEWQVFFAGLSDDPASVEKSAKGASWEKPNWPLTANGELVSALDSNWGAVEQPSPSCSHPDSDRRPWNFTRSAPRLLVGVAGFHRR